MEGTQIYNQEELAQICYYAINRIELSYGDQPSFEIPTRNGTSLDHIESPQRIGIV